MLLSYLETDALISLLRSEYRGLSESADYWRSRAAAAHRKTAVPHYPAKTLWAVFGLRATQTLYHNYFVLRRFPCSSLSFKN